MSSWIIVPLFNEALRFDLSYWRQIIDGSQFNFLFVNDGSTDLTQNLIENISLPNSSCLKLPSNVGKAEAIRAGFMYLVNQDKENLTVLGYLDSDRAFDSREVREVLEMAKSVLEEPFFDTVWFARVKLAGRDIQRNQLRHLSGRLIATFLGFGVKNYPYDTQCGFKVFKFNSNFHEAIKSPFQTRWFVDIEIYARISTVRESWIKVLEVPLNTWREVGNSKIRSTAILSIFSEVIRIKSLLRKTQKGLFGGSQRN